MSNENTEHPYRPGLPPLPAQLRRLPVERGYPVPWFVALINGRYDFHIADQRKFTIAIRKHLCWICGQRLGKEFVFPIGPMCAVNRTTAEPPSHPDCAEWAAQVCPFLIQKEAARREAGMPDGIVEAPGMMLRRQPGGVLLWRTNSFTLFADGKDGTLIQIGNPLSVAWLREGREATRAEVLESIRTGLPRLTAFIQTREEERQFDAQLRAALALLPAPADGPKGEELEAVAA